MSGCTFHPNITPANKKLLSNTGDTNKPIKGFDQAVQRRKGVIEEKRKQEEQEERAARGANYAEVRKLKVIPFNLSKRIPNEKKSPDFYAEIIPIPGKVIKMKVNVNDNPITLAKNIAMIYHLSKDQQNILQENIRKQQVMISNKS